MLSQGMEIPLRNFFSLLTEIDRGSQHRRPIGQPPRDCPSRLLSSLPSVCIQWFVWIGIFFICGSRGPSNPANPDPDSAAAA